MLKQRSIRVMLVDDEEPARVELNYLLEQFDGVTVVAQAACGSEVSAIVRQMQPHLVFLDVEMPGMNGIQLAESILDMGIAPLLVFATAHEEFAVKAFELNAIDYLLKPFSKERVGRCIERVRSLMEHPVTLSSVGDARRGCSHACTKSKLAIEQNGKTTILNTDEIIMACCADGQVMLYTQTKNYSCNTTLQELQTRLGETNFFRSHRAYLVNSEKIREVIPWFNGTYNIVLDGLNDIEVPVSRQQAPRLKKLFGL